MSGGSTDDVKHTIKTDDKGKVTGLLVTYESDEECLKVSGQKKSLSIMIECNSEYDNTISSGTIDSDVCNPTITVQSKQGCAVFQASSWVKFLGAHPWILGIIFCVLGAFSCFIGYKFFPVLTGTVGGGAVFLFTMRIFSLFGWTQSLDPNSHESVAFGVVLVIIALLFGIAAGFFIAKLVHVGAIFLGTIGGFFLGITVYNVFLFATGSAWALWGCIILFTLIGAIVGWKFHD